MVQSIFEVISSLFQKYKAFEWLFQDLFLCIDTASFPTRISLTYPPSITIKPWVCPYSLACKRAPEMTQKLATSDGFPIPVLPIALACSCLYETSFCSGNVMTLLRPSRTGLPPPYRHFLVPLFSSYTSFTESIWRLEEWGFNFHQSSVCLYHWVLWLISTLE